MNFMKITPFFIKEKTFFYEIQNKQKIVIAFGHPNCIWCEKIIFDFPILMYKVLKNWYKLKFCNYKLFPEESKKLWIKTTPSLYIKTWDKIEFFVWHWKIKQKIKKI